MVIRKGVMIKTVTRPSGVVSGKLIPIFIVLMIFFSAVSAEPPPGSPEVENSVCDTNSTPGGICDDYDSSLDQTSGDHWSKISVILQMESAEQISIEVFIALHELARDQLGLQQIDLGGDSTEQDGIPADHIRNFFDEQTGNGETVSERMFSQVDEMVMNVLGENFQSIGLPVTNTVSDVPRTLDEDITCTADASSDSADEVLERENNPFHPPICIRSALSVTINASSIGMDDTRGDLDRTLIGLLVMGAKVDLVFDLVVEAGQSMEMSLIPPEYSESFISRQGTSLATRSTLEGLTQRFAVVNMDRTNHIDTSGPSSLSLDTSIQHLQDDTETVDLTSTELPGVSIELIVDAKDTNRARFGLDISLYHLDASTLEAWSVDLDQDGVEMPWITADGFRLLDEETDIGLERLLDGLPMEKISESLSDILGNQIELGNPFFTPSTETGGLQFLHTENTGCEEEAANRYCLSGPIAMNNTYPILISAISNPTPVELSDTFQRLVENSDLDIPEIDLSTFTDEDLARIMSVTSIDISHDLSWLEEGLTETIPDSELGVKIELPSWIASGTGEPGVLELGFEEDGVDQELSLIGTRPFDWEHPICMESTDCNDDSWDLLCKSYHSTCISSTLALEIEKIAFKELSSSVIMDFKLDFTIDIYRVDSDLGIDGLDTSPIPSDLIRHVISMGDKIEGGILDGTGLGRIDSPFPDDNHPLDLDISNEGMEELADEMTDRIKLQMIEFSNMQHDYVQIVEIGEYKPKFDLAGTPVKVDIEPSNPIQSPYLSDLDPFQVGVSVTNAQMRVSLIEDSLSMRVSEQNLFRAALRSAAISMSPEVGRSGIGPFSISMGITPIDEDTEFGELRPVLIEEIKFPEGIKILEFESELSRGRVIEDGGHQTLIYLTPVYDCVGVDDQDPCQVGSDTITLSVEIGWQIIFREASPYILGILSLIGLMVWRKWRKGIINRRVNANKLEDATMEWVESLN